jgi:cytochrome c biogenesis protein
MSLVIPRRRVWVKVDEDGIQVAALARGDDPMLNRVVNEMVTKLSQKPEKTEDAK